MPQVRYTMPKKKSASVHKAVSELLLAPKEADAEEADYDGTAARGAKILSDDDDDAGLVSDSEDRYGLSAEAFDFAQERSGLRMQNAGLLHEQDPKYRAKKVVSSKQRERDNTRAMAGKGKKTKGEEGEDEALDWKEQEQAEWGDMIMGKEGDDDDAEEEDGEEEEDESDEEVEYEEEEEEAEADSEENEEDEDEEGTEDDEDMEDEEDEEDMEDEEEVDEFDAGDDINLARDDDEEEEMEDEEEEESKIELLSRTDVAKEISRGRAIKRQLAVSERLLECRIQLQKSLTKVNRLPQHDTFAQFREQGDDQHAKALKRAQGAVRGVLDELLALQTDMANTSSEVKRAFRDDEDEEEEDEEEDLQPPAKKMKVSQYSEVLESRWNSLRAWRDDTIQYWNEKTRLAANPSSKSFSGFESSTLKQIEQILSDKERLYRRTWTKRSAYRVLGKEEQDSEGKGKGEAGLDDDDLPTSEEARRRQPQQEVDEEIFDDDDFYHQLLRDLIDRKAAAAAGGEDGQLTAQWQQLQKMRSKMKGKVDTRASKGRKTRYDIHAKLVSFMAPVYEETWADETKNELFGCLFGKNDEE